MNGSLGNLAGGVMLMFFRPFKKGDLIEAQGAVGEVLEIGMLNTVLLSPEKKPFYSKWSLKHGYYYQLYDSWLPESRSANVNCILRQY